MKNLSLLVLISFIALMFSCGGGESMKETADIEINNLISDQCIYDTNSKLVGGVKSVMVLGKTYPCPQPPPQPPPLAIGDFYQGGIVAYILQPGDPSYSAGVQHGLIAATSDQSTGIQWYNGSYMTTGATATALGTGQANTDTIVASQGAGSYAAKRCADYANSDFGTGIFSDWFLPSYDELFVIGGMLIGQGLHWSSSEMGDVMALASDWITSEMFVGGTYVKNNYMPVRCVRSF